MEEGMALNNVGDVYWALGRYGEAFNAYQSALLLYPRQDDWLARMSLNGIGKVYWVQGRLDEALETFQEALSLHPEIDDPVLEGNILNNIGRLYTEQGRYTEALDNFQEALTIAHEKKDRTLEGITLNNIGNMYEAQGYYVKALENYQESLTIADEEDNRALAGTTLNEIGDVHYSRGRYAKALESYQQALAIAQELGAQTMKGVTFKNIGTVYEVQGHHVEALKSYQQAMNILEVVRVTAGNEQSRAGFIAQYADLYTRTSGLFYREGQNEAAFLTSERGRARSFLDSLATGQVKLINYQFADLLLRWQGADARRQVIQEELARARALNPPNPNLVASLENQLDEAESAMTEISTDLDARNYRLTALVPGRSNVLDVSEVQFLLDGQTVLLSYFILDNQTLAFLLTRASFEVVELPVSRQELTNRVSYFRKSIAAHRSAATNQAAQELYELLIAPLKEAKEERGSRWVIVPHGVLHYLPFAALQNPKTGHYLMQDYSLAMLPSASALPFVTTTDQRPTTVDETPQRSNVLTFQPSNPLIVGNPATGDFDATASLATERTGLSPLPYAEQEAKAIAALYGVEPLLGQEATESAVRQRVGSTAIVHLAAHGFYNPYAPLSSFIALAPDPTTTESTDDDHPSSTDNKQSPTSVNPKSKIVNRKSADGWLTVGEIYGLDLSQTELVVLSACETQVGQAGLETGLGVTAGDEVVGLTRAFFFAGTPAVIASLWNVNDQSTGVLMERFYTHLQAGLPKAEALRQAQLDMLTDYPDLYDWAAFVLSGEGGR
ncbi:MAG: CHAT domain-containing protein [Chloroflexota bacterium]